MPDRPVRVLRVITRLNVGGPAQHVAYLASGLGGHGFQTRLVSGRIDPGEGDMSYFCGQRGVQVEYVDALIRPISPLRDLVAFFQIAAWIWRTNPDVIHTHLAKAGFLARFAARLLKFAGRRPVLIHTYHGHVFHSYFSNRQNSLHLFLEKMAARWTHRIIAVSSRLRDELVETYEIAPAKKFRVVPLGFDLDPFLKIQRRCGEFRGKIGVDQKTELVGIVGRLTAVKDHLLFLESFAELLKEFPRAAAVIVGGGEEKERIRKHAEWLGIPDRIRWTGFLKDLPQVYSDLDALVLTSRNEGTPVAVIEAQAAGCPVVAADVGGVGDAMVGTCVEEESGLRRMSGGYLALNRSPRTFAAACRKILLDQFKPDPAVRELAGQKFGVTRLCEDIAHLYKNALTEAGAKL